MPKIAKDNLFAATIRRLCMVHFVYVFAFAASIVAYHAGNLLPTNAIMRRWTVAACMLVVTTIIWYYTRTQKVGTTGFRTLVYCLACMDILFAGYLVYAERGMASLGVALFAIPLAVVATLGSRPALWATASICMAVYAYAAIRYFVDFFNEGYKLQLYTTLGFYGALFFVLAGVLIVVNRATKS